MALVTRLSSRVWHPLRTANSVSFSLTEKQLTAFPGCLQGLTYQVTKWLMLSESRVLTILSLIPNSLFRYSLRWGVRLLKWRKCGRLTNIPMRNGEVSPHSSLKPQRQHMLSIGQWHPGLICWPIAPKKSLVPEWPSPALSTFKKKKLQDSQTYIYIYAKYKVFVLRKQDINLPTSFSVLLVQINKCSFWLFL